MKHPSEKYRAFPALPMPGRKWPDKSITKAPRWCSVDLRDGNQSLIIPMDMRRKLDFFQLLLEMGFKEIETGFPSASEVEFEFNRRIIEDKLIPDDVTIQVLTQARENLIRRTFEALRGTRKAILHIYNSTSPQQRKFVFGKSKEEIKDIAVQGVRLIKELAKETDTHISLEYSPESFSATELDFSLEICRAVMDTWEPTLSNKIILNLPATVEVSSPNHYADQIEWFIDNLPERDKAVISVHTHNDRGTAVAASELALMAGGERVEGTLFGNGERTGNVDIVTLALNMYSQGVDPGLNFHDINKIKEVYERCTHLTVHNRHPYAGELVYTAFSGSHQDAINKGMTAYTKMGGGLWEVPYLPIDPEDVGRSYEAIIRINSQSGKGGLAYIMERYFGFQLPKKMHPDFGAFIQVIADQTGKELPPDLILESFKKEYLGKGFPIEFFEFESAHRAKGVTKCNLSIRLNGKEMKLVGTGNGPVDASKAAILSAGIENFRIQDYHEHSMGSGSDAQAAAYIEIGIGEKVLWGAGIDSDITVASVKALISALNRYFAGKPQR